MQQIFVLTQNICIWVIMTEPWRTQKIPWGEGGNTDLEGATAPPRGPNGAPANSMLSGSV